MKRSAAPGEVHARGGQGEARRYKLPIVAADCEDAGVCLKFSCRWNTALDITGAGRFDTTSATVVKMQHGDRFGEAGQWPDGDDEAHVDRLVAWLETVETTCIGDHIARCGAMEMRDIADQLGVSKELVYRDLRSATGKIAASPQADALRQLLLARFEAANDRETAQPDHEE